MYRSELPRRMAMLGSSEVRWSARRGIAKLSAPSRRALRAGPRDGPGVPLGALARPLSHLQGLQPGLAHPHRGRWRPGRREPTDAGDGGAPDMVGREHAGDRVTTWSPTSAAETSSGAEGMAIPSAPRVRRRRVRGQGAIETPIADDMRLHGSAKLVVPSPAMTEPRANTWPTRRGGTSTRPSRRARRAAGVGDHGPLAAGLRARDRAGAVDGLAALLAAGLAARAVARHAGDRVARADDGLRARC